MTGAAEWRTLRQALEQLSASVTEQIGSYPGPITACDAQFNHLLDLRRLLPSEIDRLDRAAEGDSESIEAFLRASPCAGDLTKLLPRS
ncbi:MAG: hypothetical protein QF578_00615 [Alphaproteobacteria bacterium]|jgi:hypothetical protein|nr:hypothetical protein [Alphaproteobacteria bacterium]MDP6563306.1 hypothetical protein [Alphaproteobacteria bacterium]